MRSDASWARRSRPSRWATVFSARKRKTRHSSRTMSTNSSWIKNLALAGASIVVTLLLAEGALRVVVLFYPDSWLPDPLTGSRLRPGMEGWQRDEGRAFVKI